MSYSPLPHSLSCFLSPPDHTESESSERSVCRPDLFVAGLTRNHPYSPEYRPRCSKSAQSVPEPWLGPWRLTTTRPARPRWAGAESRSFERCAPTTSRRDPTPASSTPLRAHGPRAAHICTSTTAMRTRCGEGDLVGGWHAGASPFIPITRWVTNRGSSSASLAKPYTPFGRSQRL